MAEGVLVCHKIGSFPIGQRMTDGYVNATLLCQACGRFVADYLRLDNTKSFMATLSETMGIPIVSLVETREGRNGGTWVHPRVAIHLAQWCSPRFAVLVSQWVLDWMTKGLAPVKQTRLPVYVKRLSLAWKMQMCVPDGYWTVFDKCSNLLILVECDLKIPVDTFDLLDGSVGIRWAKHRQGQMWAGERIPFTHIFPDKRGSQQAWAYLLQELPHFEKWLRGTYVSEHLPKYLDEKYALPIPARQLLSRVAPKTLVNARDN
jgi:hypothetical protein